MGGKEPEKRFTIVSVHHLSTRWCLGEETDSIPISSNGHQRRNRALLNSPASGCDATVAGYGNPDPTHDKIDRNHYSEKCDLSRGCAISRLKRDLGVNGVITSGNCSRKI